MSPGSPIVEEKVRELLVEGIKREKEENERLERENLRQREKKT